ncbi:MAG: FG-GAP repeat protein [Planctomycetes bacterium]|nr:FG-GAP repeat protein [Planctomycetota bacterium]MBI3847570.1 FG-GAP repeat protein [Planctomycetota bacterium]
MHRTQSLAATLLGGAACLLCLEMAHAQQLVDGPYRLHSQLDSQNADRFGAAVATAGDVDGDGYDDVLVGAPGADSSSLIDNGSVFLFSGKGGSLLHRFDGLAAMDEFGFSVAGDGDVDGDGVPDILVGAPGARVGGVANTGHVYVYSGATFTQLYDLPGRKPGGRFGHRVIFPGDLDNEGHSEIAASAPLANIQGLAQAGKVFVINNDNPSQPRVMFSIKGLVAGEQVGTSLAAAGDANRDGIPDMAIGSPEVTNGNLQRSGRVAIVSGASGQIHRITGFEAEGELGYSVSGGYDFDGDGNADVVIGAPGCSPAGRPRAGCILVYSGFSGLLLTRIDGDVPEERLGRSLDFVPDIDNDGVPEILAGASTMSTIGGSEAGFVILFSGRTGLQLFRYTGSAAEQHAGFAIARAGDIDGDGHSDVIIGSPSTDSIPGSAKAELYMFNNAALSIEGQPQLGGSFAFTLSGEPLSNYLLLISPHGAPNSGFSPIPYPIGPGNASVIDVGLENWRFSLHNPPLAYGFPASGFVRIPMNLPRHPRYANVVLNAQFVTFPGRYASIDKVSNAISFVVLPPN